ncbi:hypothetical protein [Candidatus Ichthyocystis hellenicum]|uniref:hypothetical protein n=1 Tax=Candidatus Ichthyocystis hellenicum TaxID=1561003 RepID=UPI000B830CA0|nr:hypothetical protein [Candidatus Ichthyocystis hellenicum]
MINENLFEASNYYICDERGRSWSVENEDKSPLGDVVQKGAEEDECRSIGEGITSCESITKRESCHLSKDVDEKSINGSNAALVIVSIMALTVAALVTLGVYLYLNSNGHFNQAMFGSYMAVVGSTVLGLGTILTVASCFFEDS